MGEVVAVFRFRRFRMAIRKGPRASRGRRNLRRRDQVDYAFLPALIAGNATTPNRM